MSEANLVFNPIIWIMETGASRHICSSWSLFQEYRKVVDGEGVSRETPTLQKLLAKGNKPQTYF